MMFNTNLYLKQHKSLLGFGFSSYWFYGLQGLLMLFTKLVYDIEEKIGFL